MVLEGGMVPEAIVVPGAIISETVSSNLPVAGFAEPFCCGPPAPGFMTVLSVNMNDAFMPDQ